MSTDATLPRSTWMGHPNGLFLLFFVEMWERFSYYGMRALLVFYMTKGFLKLDDGSAYGIYGAYTALVYATPFVGGMLADKLLGARRAVVLGGMLMAAGHLLMTFENPMAFYVALALLICGNGFFKPNISTMVGAMYPPGSPRRDGGFTIFYMGINLGAAMSPLICGYVGETFGWHYGFGLATIGMLTGLMTFVANRRVSQVLIGLAALVTAGTMIGFHISDVMQLAVNGPVGIALIVAAFVAIGALAGNGLPDEIGRPKDVNRLTTLAVPVLQTQLQPYYLAVIAVILLIQHAVAAQSDWAMILMIVGGFIVLLPWLKANAAVYLGTIAAVPVAAILLQNRGLAGLLLSIFGGGALLMLAADAYRAEKVERERMTVVLILMFFSMLFWAFFEQAGSSVSMFTDRNVDRIVGGRVLTSADVGKTQDRVVISSALLGRDVAGQKWNLSMVNTAQDVARKVVEEAPVKVSVQDLQKEVNTAALKAVKDLVTKPTASNTKADSAPAGDSKTDEKADGQPDQKADQASDENSTDDGAGEEGGGDWSVKLRRAFLARELQPYLESVTVTDGMVGMKIEGKEVPASMFQAANAIFILIFGLVFTLLWALLASIRLEPNTAVKFSLGLLQLGLGFVAFWWGAKTSNGGIVAMGWLLLGYMFHTTGELCLSPVGLSMVTKLSPPRMVSTVMGAWFLATAFSNFLAGMIAALTGIGHGTKERGMIPFPDQTVNVYGNVFYQIAVASIIASVVLLVLSPLLVKWMHQDKEQN